LLAAADVLFQQLVALPPGSLQRVVAILLGNDTEVANMFAIDPGAGRLWVAATAPDAEDGAADGVSTLGALYGLDVVPVGGTYQVVEACHGSFAGGSASSTATPGARATSRAGARRRSR
jgi:hypothetical protein